MPIQYVYSEIYNSGQSVYPFTVQPSYYQGRINQDTFIGRYYFTDPTSPQFASILQNGTTLTQLQEGVAAVDYSGFVNLGFESAWANAYPNRNYVSIRTGTNYINPQTMQLNMAVSGSPAFVSGSPVLGTCTVFDGNNNSLIGLSDFVVRSGVHTVNVPLLLANEVVVPCKYNIHIDNIRMSGTGNITNADYKIYAMELQSSGNSLLDKSTTMSMFGDVDLVSNKKITWFDGEHGYYRDIYDVDYFPNPQPNPPETAFIGVGPESYSTQFDRSSIFNMGLYNFVSSGTTFSSGIVVFNTDKTKYCLSYPRMGKVYDGWMVDSGTLVKYTTTTVGGPSPGTNILYEQPDPIYEYGTGSRFPNLYFSDNSNTNGLDFVNYNFVQGNALYLGYNQRSVFSNTDGTNYQTSQTHTTDYRLTFFDLIPKSGDFAIYLNMTDLSSSWDNEYLESNGGSVTNEFRTRSYNDIIRNERFSFGVDKTDWTTSTTPVNFYNFILTDLSNGTQTNYSLPYASGATYGNGDEPLNTVGAFIKPRIKSFLINYSGNVMDIYGMFYGVEGMNKILTKTINNITSSGIMICDGATASSRYFFEVGGKSGSLSSTEINDIYQSINAPLNQIAHDVADFNSGIYAYVKFPEQVRRNYYDANSLTNSSVPASGITYHNNIKHYASNLLTINDRLDYEIVGDSPVIMKVIAQYTGTHPSGLFIRPCIFVDGNNTKNAWGPSGQYLFNSGITTLTFSGTYANTLPYPLGSGASIPMMALKVLTHGVSGVQTFSGGDFRIYAIDLRADVLEADPTGVVGNIPLFTKGAGPTSSGMTLYLEMEERADRLNLFIKGNGDTKNSGVPLSVWTVGSSSGTATKSTTLHTYSATPTSGDMLLYIEANYAQGVRFNTGENTPFPLYLHSKVPSGNVDLYLYNEVIQMSGGANLYTVSALPTNTDMPLYVSGGGIDARLGSTTLYVGNYGVGSGNVPLNIIGNTSFANVNLYINSEDLPTVNSGTDLFISSALNSGIYNGFDLHVEAEGSNTQVPLYINVRGDEENNDNLYLFILNDTETKKDVLLYVENHVSGIVGNTRLYVGGNGGINGATPSYGNMTLFINRAVESVANVVPLTMNGPSGAVSTVPLIINGGTITNNSVYLNIPSTAGLKNSGITNFIHGF